ncbi:Polycomb group protein FIE1 [Zea mays]|uniref:Polycomb group protein FIE1 n=1 Tax=Zea mays TaxID=4577 RepID=A0A3L6F7T4_MAIZE|nr:fertilization-independent endosperm protein 1 [Zea mays]PWZ29195.1 Polycomb group protein FIE1 [Zea mays]
MPPSKARRKRSLRDITATVATGPVANSKPGSSSTNEGKQHDKKKEGPQEPDIPPLPPVVVNIVPRQGLGCEVVEGLLVPSRKREYKPNSKYTVGNHPIYAIGFNFIDMRYYDVFAIASCNSVIIYRCLENGGFGLLQNYVDEDKDESFYTLSWTIDQVDSSPLLVAAGSNRIIRVINCATEKLDKSLVGHGGSIHEIRTHASKPSLIISASKDESIRLWNVHTGICILVFAGAGGHRHDVLSVDFHPTEVGIFASCGMDNTVKIWSMKEFWIYVEKSYSWTGHPSKFPTRNIQFPVLTAAVHSDYVDCTRWLGDFILSKSVKNAVLLWEPKPDKRRPGEGSVDVLQKYPVPKCSLWFMKFSCDFYSNQMAIGNNKGEIYVWEVQSSPPVLIDRLCNQECKSPIRQTAVSFDGSTILGAADDGAIWRWDEVDPAASSSKPDQAAAPAAGAGADADADA